MLQTPSLCAVVCCDIFWQPFVLENACRAYSCKHTPFLQATDGFLLPLQIDATTPWASDVATALVYLKPKSETSFYFEEVVV